MKKETKSDRKILSFDAQAMFCRQLGFVVKSGILLSDAYEFLKTEMQGYQDLDVIEQVFERIKTTGNFAIALRDTGCFSEYLCSIVELGEKTGTLENLLFDLADYFEQRSILKRKITQAFTYPFILLAMMLCVILFLIIAVLPQFGKIISSSGGTVPPFAQGMLNFGSWVQHSWYYIVIVIAVLVVAALIFVRSKAGKRLSDRFVLSKFGFGKTSRKLYASRFCFAMQIALACGNSLSDAIKLSSDIMSNDEVKSRLLKLDKLIADGMNMTTAMESINLFPKSFISLFATSYKTGSLEETLSRLSSQYQESYYDSVYDLSSKVEPALVIVISLIACVILFSVMIPIINIMQIAG